MSWLRRFFGSAEHTTQAAEEQAVLLTIAQAPAGDRGLDLIEDPIASAIEKAGIGEYDGHEHGPEGSVIFLYGPDADAILDLVQSMETDGTIQLPPSTTVEVRYGGPGAESRIVVL